MVSSERISEREKARGKSSLAPKSKEKSAQFTRDVSKSKAQMTSSATPTCEAQKSIYKRRLREAVGEDSTPHKV